MPNPNLTVPTFPFHGFSIPIPLLEKTGGGADTFEIISLGHIKMLKEWANLSASDRVFELGCGIGRDSIPLTAILNSGSYVGVDIIRESINWCKNNIESRFPNFKFNHLNIKDQLHNTNGDLLNTQVNFDYQNKFDLIFLQSVFTHMFDYEIFHYLLQFRKMLTSDGQALLSCFVFDDATLQSARKSQTSIHRLGFQHRYDVNTYVNDKGVPRGAVAFQRNYFVQLIQRAGFKIAREERGSWSGRFPSSTTGQDIFVIQPDCTLTIAEPNWKLRKFFFEMRCRLGMI